MSRNPAPCGFAKPDEVQRFNERECERLRAPDEADDVWRVGAVFAVTAAPASNGSQKAQSLIVSQRLDGDTGLRSHGSDSKPLPVIGHDAGLIQHFLVVGFGDHR